MHTTMEQSKTSNNPPSNPLNAGSQASVLAKLKKLGISDKVLAHVRNSGISDYNILLTKLSKYLKPGLLSENANPSTNFADNLLNPEYYLHTLGDTNFTYVDIQPTENDAIAHNAILLLCLSEEPAAIKYIASLLEKDESLAKYQYWSYLVFFAQRLNNTNVANAIIDKVIELQKNNTNKDLIGPSTTPRHMLVLSLIDRDRKEDLEWFFNYDFSAYKHKKNWHCKDNDRAASYHYLTNYFFLRNPFLRECCQKENSTSSFLTEYIANAKEIDSCLQNQNILISALQSGDTKTSSSTSTTNTAPSPKSTTNVMPTSSAIPVTLVTPTAIASASASAAEPTPASKPTDTSSSTTIEQKQKETTKETTAEETKKDKEKLPETKPSSAVAPNPSISPEMLVKNLITKIVEAKSDSFWKKQTVTHVVPYTVLRMQTLGANLTPAAAAKIAKEGLARHLPGTQTAATMFYKTLASCASAKGEIHQGSKLITELKGLLKAIEEYNKGVGSRSSPSSSISNVSLFNATNGQANHASPQGQYTITFR